MNMKRALLVLALSFLAHREACGDVLWWMIGSDYTSIEATTKDGTTVMTAEELGVSDVRVRYDGNDGSRGYLTLFGVNQDGSVSVYDGSLNMGGEHGVGLPAEYFADLSSLSPQDYSYSFVIELGNWDNGTWLNTAMESESRTYEELVSLNHIKKWQNTVPTYGQAWTPDGFTVVPEPTSAVLLVFGASLLALRRRRRFTGFAVACVFLSGSIFAAALDDSCVSFSTQGPDRYADGCVVLDGECYALVWSADGEFNGFSADGSCVDGEDRVVLLAPVARGGRCPPVLFQISAEIYKELSGGVLAVYLLDTRVSSGEKVAPRGTVGGKLELLNGYGAVSASVAAKGDRMDGVASEADSDAGQTASSLAGARQDCAQPRIKAMRIEGDNVYLTVENLKGYMRVHAGSDVGASQSAGAAVESSGSAQDVVLVAPKKGGSGFYKVVRSATDR
jgi:hypothetical protein